MKNIISVIVLLSTGLFGQQQTDWKNYADMKNVKDVLVTDNGIWAATTGGAFFYNFSDSSYKTFSRSEGINGIDLTAVARDINGKIWFGSSSGIVDVYDPVKENYHSIMDIQKFESTNKSINDFLVSGDTIFVATDFGISLINADNYFFYDTYFKFGSFTSKIKVNCLLKTDLIYLATNSGIAIQKTGASNLSAPESWNVYTNQQGLPNDTISSLVFYNSSLLAGTDNGIYKFDGTNWSSFLNLSNVKIIDLYSANGLLYVLSRSRLYQFDGTVLSELSVLPNIPAKLGYSNQENLLIATSKGILASGKTIYPNGPEANQYPQMTFDRDGNLWSSSGKDASGVGIYKFDGESWETYDISHYPEMYTNGYYSIFCASDNSIYSGNWGQGFIKIKNNSIQRFHAGNTPMIGIPSAPGFIVISGIAEDSGNNIWTLNLRAADRKALYALTPDSLWFSFQNLFESYQAFTELKNLVIDQSGTKWYCLTNEGNLGLYYYNEKSTLNNTNDDVYGYLGTTKGLASNDIFSLAVDRRGDLWIGSNAGVNIITNVSAILNSSNPQFNITRSFPVRSEVINAIAVDPLNQKWLGTNEGLFLLSSDGTQLLASVNTKNSPLLSDVIESLAFDESTGRLYVGTEKGLTSFKTPSIVPVENFNGLFIYPNPLIINDDTKLVTIDGLIKDTEIKIFSVSGKLIREFSSPGGRVAFWDGRDDFGNYVNSGVYIVVAYDQEGNSVETGKIAVLRE